MRRSTAHSRYSFILSLTIGALSAAFNLAVFVFALLIYAGVQ